MLRTATGSGIVPGRRTSPRSESRSTHHPLQRLNDSTSTGVTIREFTPVADDGSHTVTGDLRIVTAVSGRVAEDLRDLLVLLPGSYESESRRRYAVMYMHDGQNLFDEASSFSGEWRVDEAMQELAQEGLEAIVVGIPNLGEGRIEEYSPFADPKHGGGGGEEYLRFVVEGVKPLIDAAFRTLPEREHTLIVGSSMGGLISLYAFFRYPEIFGAVGALSPSLWFSRGAIFGLVEEAPPVPGRVYLDVGTAEGRRTVHNVRRLRRILHRKGYDADHSLRYVEEEGAEHGEAWWAARFTDAARFLLNG